MISVDTLIVTGYKRDNGFCGIKQGILLPRDTYSNDRVQEIDRKNCRFRVIRTIYKTIDKGEDSTATTNAIPYNQDYFSGYGQRIDVYPAFSLTYGSARSDFNVLLLQPYECSGFVDILDFTSGICQTLLGQMPFEAVLQQEILAMGYGLRYGYYDIYELNNSVATGYDGYIYDVFTA